MISILPDQKQNKKKKSRDNVMKMPSTKLKNQTKNRQCSSHTSPKIPVVSTMCYSKCITLWDNIIKMLTFNYLS